MKRRGVIIPLHARLQAAHLGTRPSGPLIDKVRSAAASGLHVILATTAWPLGLQNVSRSSSIDQHYIPGFSWLLLVFRFPETLAEIWKPRLETRKFVRLEVQNCSQTQMFHRFM